MWLEICLPATLLLPPLWSLSIWLSYLHPGACTDHSRPWWLLCSTRPPFRTEGLHPQLLGLQLADGLFGNRPLLKAAALLMAVPLLGHSPHPVTDQWGKVDRPGSCLSWVQLRQLPQLQSSLWGQLRPCWDCSAAHLLPLPSPISFLLT